MTQDYTITLPRSEMLTTAGLLGYESIFLISDDQVPDDPKLLLKQLRKGLGKLEQKQLLRIELDGTLQIQPELMAIFACLCVPETVALVEHNLPAGRKSVSYLLQSSQGTVLAQKGQKDDYTLRLLSKLTPETIFPAAFLAAKAAAFDTELPLADAQLVRRYTESFDQSSALAHLASILPDQAPLQTLLEALSGTSGYLSMRIVRAKTALYRTAAHQLLALVGDSLLQVYADRKETVFFRGIAPDAVAAQLLTYFQS